MTNAIWTPALRAERRILVTGAAGLIGASLVGTLRAGGYDVLGTDIAVGPPGAGEIARCDLSRPEATAALANKGPFHTIVHCGAISGPMLARDRPDLILAANLSATANLLELARRGGAARFVYCSSTSVYGDLSRDGLIGEDQALHPKTVYGATKAAGELLVSSYAAQFAFSDISLRISTVYGPARRNFCAIRQLVAAAVAGEPARLAFGRDHYRQYVHVADVCGALRLAIETEQSAGLVCNLTGGSYLTLAEIAERVKAQFPALDYRISEEPDPAEDMHGEFSIERARRLLNYTPAISIDDGIADLARHLARASTTG